MLWQLLQRWPDIKSTSVYCPLYTGWPSYRQCWILGSVDPDSSDSFSRPVNQRPLNSLGFFQNPAGLDDKCVSRKKHSFRMGNYNGGGLTSCSPLCRSIATRGSPNRHPTENHKIHLHFLSFSIRKAETDLNFWNGNMRESEDNNIYMVKF